MTSPNADFPAPARRPVPVRVQIIVWSVLLAMLAFLGADLLRSGQGALPADRRVPDFSLSLLEGYGYNGRQEISLAELGGKVVLINFWASWCFPCEQEAADLQAAWEHYEPGGRVVFLGIDYLDTAVDGRAYLAKYGISFPNGEDLGTRISQLFRIAGVPETYILDGEGILRTIKIGPFASVEEIRLAIDPLLGEE